MLFPKKGDDWLFGGFGKIWHLQAHIPIWQQSAGAKEWLSPLDSFQFALVPTMPSYPPSVMLSDRCLSSSHYAITFLVVQLREKLKCSYTCIFIKSEKMENRVRVLSVSREEMWKNIFLCRIKSQETPLCDSNASKVCPCQNTIQKTIGRVPASPLGFRPPP